MWPVMLAAAAGAVAGTIVTRLLDKAVPPPAQKVVLVDPNRINVGDFILVKGAFDNGILHPANGDNITPLRMQIVELDSPQTVRAVFADPRFPLAAHDVSIDGVHTVGRADVLMKTT